MNYNPLKNDMILHLPRRYSLILLGGFFFTLLSCNYFAKQRIYDIVQKWQGKTIIFPDTLDIKVQGKEAILDDSIQPTYFILNYIDTSDCLSCDLKLYEWQLLQKELDSLNINVDILFVVWTNQYDNLEHQQRVNKCMIPCVYDSKNNIANINEFPTESYLHTFLLDSMDQVLLLGNPINNESIRKLYIEEMLY